MRKCVCILMVCTLCTLSGCSSRVSDLNDSQRDIVAGYAADSLLKYDKNYNYKYEEIETTTQEATFAPEETTKKNESETSGSGQGSSEEETTKADTASTIEEALGLDGFSVECTDFELTDSYPSDNQKDALFIMKAVKDTKLLVVKVKVKNVSGSKKELNIMSYNARYRAIVNDKTRLNAQITLLLDAFNTYEGSFKKNETKEMVLVFQTALKSKSDISSLDIYVAGADKSGTITLK